jgi:regulator of sigma E protease
MLLTLFYFILALLLLILVHEYGHFLVARWCGVKVLRFSFGFGKVLASWKDKRGTEYALSLIPLGGYVKMLDESEGDVAENERHLAFNHQPIWARIAIVLAGPLFNFLFAFVALWLVLVIGVTSLAPIIQDVRPGSIAAQAGLTAKQEITAINGHPVMSWRDVLYALMPHVGTNKPLPMSVISHIDGKTKQLMFSLGDWQLNEKKPDVLKSLGIVPFVPTIPPVVGDVIDESPARSAGLRTGDEITSVDGRAIKDWLALVDEVRQRPHQRMVLSVMREGHAKTLVIHTGSTIHYGREEGVLGVRSLPIHGSSYGVRLQREPPLRAASLAFDQTMVLTGATFAFIGRIIMGQLPLQSISGPVGIAQGAGESARSGLPYYLSFLALVSISLGVLNVLPIPLLDGGHLLYYLIELIRRRPMSDGLQSMGMYLGFVFLIAMTFIALKNDITRLL